MFFYFRIDARQSAGIARFINDGWRQSNLRVKVYTNKHGLPVPVFLANRDIAADTELLYNYGPGRYPWRLKGF